ncbi:PQQ-binding-like beta-propeller repeat protein [Streptomyces lavendulocolor]|uniref:outer membrane protein assembly factor BamB family protein n=1 Tax=Streptomyces lavendulocolor TaxID=67316 RepID=UPI003C2D13CB
MPEDGQNVPKPGTPPRKQGRPQKNLTAQGAQREFAEVIRAEFFDRLARLGVTTAQISKALGDGFSVPSLSKFRAGERVPDRDKLLRLLAFAEEKAGRPLPDGVKEHVLEKYYAALRETNVQLHDFYRLLDEREKIAGERDIAREEQRRTGAKLVECQASLSQVRYRVEQLEAESRRAELEELRRQEREEAAENEAVRLQERHDQLERAVRQARVGQQAAHKEIRRLQNQLVQQTEESARSEASLRETNAELAAKTARVSARVAELEQTEQALRAELEQVTATLEQVRARNHDLASQHAVVLRSRALVGQRLSQARQQRRDLEVKQAALKQRETAAMRKLTAAQRRVADAESRLVAVYRSRDALLDNPAAPDQVVTEAVEAVDAAWQSYEVEISRIEQHAVVPTGGTIALDAGGTGEPAGETATEPDPEVTGADQDEDRGERAPAPPPQHVPASPAEPERPLPKGTGLTPIARARLARKAAGMGVVDVMSWTLFGTFVLFAFLVSTVRPQDWWPRSNDGAKDSTSQDDTSGMEEDEPVAPDAGPTPKWASSLPHPLYNRPVLEGTVVVTTAYRAAVHGVDARTGRRLWSAPTSDSINRQPVVSSGVVYLTSFGDLHAIDVRTGKVKWKKTDDFVDSLTVGNGAVVTISSFSEVTALRQSDGRVLWSTDLDSTVMGPPASAKDTVFVSAQTGEIYALDAKTGTVKWRKSIAKKDALNRGPTVAGAAVIAATDTQIVSLDLRSGKELWRRDHRTTTEDLSMITSGGLLISTATAKDGRTIIARDLKTGAEKWNSPNQKDTAQPLSLSAHTDRVYVTYDSEKLCAHSATDGKILECFAGINTLPGTVATADGVYANSYNQRLYYFPKGTFG